MCMKILVSWVQFPPCPHKVFDDLGYLFLFPSPFANSVDIVIQTRVIR
jgi:hypothetical protein